MTNRDPRIYVCYAFIASILSMHFQLFFKKCSKFHYCIKQLKTNVVALRKKSILDCSQFPTERFTNLMGCVWFEALTLHVSFAEGSNRAVICCTLLCGLRCYNCTGRAFSPIKNVAKTISAPIYSTTFKDRLQK